MKCPKCHSEINDNETVCPKCHKVLLLECPNCHSLEETAVCTQCGYKILIKCSKCGRINPTINDVCVKCGFSTKTSLAYQECESDELASVIIKFNNLKKIRRILKAKDLYQKFYYRLKNLLLAQIKNAGGLFIKYDNAFVVNFNKELSFATSSNKAVRFALKTVNSLVQLNSNTVKQLRTPLGINITIIKKSAEKLQELCLPENHLKLLNTKKDIKNYLKDIQIVLDQSVWEEIRRDYKTDSLYSIEENGATTMFYEIVTDSYVLPPDNEKEESSNNAAQHVLNKSKSRECKKEDVYSFKVFDINAKCKFDKSTAVSIKDKLTALDFNKNGKIVALRSELKNRADISDIITVYKKQGFDTLIVNCTEEMTFKPWGFFIQLFKEYYSLPCVNFTNLEKINSEHLKIFRPLFELCLGNAVKSSTPEDARFNYMENWSKFLSILSKTVIIVDGFELLDDTSIQTIELYFDKYRNIKPNFVFVTSDNISVHSKIKTLMSTNLYTEIKLTDSSFSNCLSSLKPDASDFIGSFYFEKIQENFDGSYLFFKYAINYLINSGVLVNFENKLLVRDSKSVIVPNDITDLYKSVTKHLCKKQHISQLLILFKFLGTYTDLSTLEKFKIPDLPEIIKLFIENNLAVNIGNSIILNNAKLMLDAISEVVDFDKELIKDLLAKIGNSRTDKSIKAILQGNLKNYNSEYALLCENADFSISTGDYDAYLKNCLGFLSLIETVESSISVENLEERKKGVYNSILMYLYSYQPAKIYFIENILLMDAINENNDEKIVKLSNLMLQGALISSNYTDALGLLHNILSRMKTPTLLIDGVVNTKFLLLSLVHIEILYNIGKYRECVDTAVEILSVIRIEIIDKIKPISFSTNLFVSHLLETMRLAGLAKLYLMDNNIEQFFDLIKTALNTELPEKDCILAIRDYLADKVYQIGNIEEYSPFSKVIFLILQELSNLNGDYKTFAQNIYQAKLLSEDIHQQEIKYLCDTLIAYAYSKIGITFKADTIYKDVMQKSETSAMFNSLAISKYFLALLYKDKEPQVAIRYISDSLDLIKNNNNQHAILYALFEKLYIDITKTSNINIDTEIEEKKLEPYKENLKLIVG